jgi:hypothetical protein
MTFLRGAVRRASALDRRRCKLQTLLAYCIHAPTHAVFSALFAIPMSHQRRYARSLRVSLFFDDNQCACTPCAPQPHQRRGGSVDIESFDGGAVLMRERLCG